MFPQNKLILTSLSFSFFKINVELEIMMGEGAFYMTASYVNKKNTMLISEL